jgi:anti-anti-sigma factor
MKIIVKKRNGIYILSLIGHIDEMTSPEFKEKVMEVIRTGTPSIILDCEELDYISSAGLRVCLEAYKQAKKSGGKIVICSLSDYIKETFAVSGFEEILPMVTNVENAVKEF